MTFGTARESIGRKAGPVDRALWNPGEIEGAPQGQDRIRRNEGMYQAVVVRMLGSEPGAIQRRQRTRLSLERDVSEMFDEDIRGEHVFPAPMRGTHAEVILFAIAEPERLSIEEPRFAQAIPADVHAESNRGGNLYGLPGMQAAAQIIERFV